MWLSWSFPHGYKVAAEAPVITFIAGRRKKGKGAVPAYFHFVLNYPWPPSKSVFFSVADASKGKGLMEYVLISFPAPMADIAN